jgi:hypothetical protein
MLSSHIKHGTITDTMDIVRTRKKKKKHIIKIPHIRTKSAK